MNYHMNYRKTLLLVATVALTLSFAGAAQSDDTYALFASQDIRVGRIPRFDGMGSKIVRPSFSQKNESSICLRENLKQAVQDFREHLINADRGRQRIADGKDCLQFDLRSDVNVHLVN